MIRTDIPCYMCTERRIGCHADCEKYNDYRKKREAVYNERAALAVLKPDTIRRAVIRRLREAMSKRRNKR